MSIRNEARKLFQIRPIQYHCVHTVAEALKISLIPARDCVNNLKREGSIRFAFKDICIYSKRKHKFYYVNNVGPEKTKVSPKKITARLIQKPEPATKTAIITDKNKNRVIFKKAKIVEIDKDIVHIVEV